MHGKEADLRERRDPCGLRPTESVFRPQIAEVNAVNAWRGGVRPAPWDGLDSRWCRLTARWIHHAC